MAGKRHHYVPRAYLALFTDPETPSGQEPYVWVYEREEKEPYARAPHKLAVRTHYYSVASGSGEWDTAVEEFLSRIESEAMPVLRRFGEGADPSALSDKERGWLAYFIAMLSVRIPGLRSRVEEFSADLMRRVALMGAHNSEYFERKMREAYEAKGQEPPKDIEAVRHFVLSGEYDVIASPVISLRAMIEMAPVVAKNVAGYHWRVLRAPVKTYFIISDRPVILVSTKKLPPPFGWSAGWETPWMEATVPLSPEACLLISLHHPQGIEVVTTEIVREINLRTASHASEAVYSSRRLEADALNRQRDWTWWKPVTEALVTPATDDSSGDSGSGS